MTMTKEQTAQEVFDQVVTHLLTQNQRSYLAKQDGVVSTCAYRGDGGLACAVGCLLDDEEYDPSLEGRGLAYVFDRAPRLAPHTRQLQALQQVHDHRTPPSWRTFLRTVANRHNLVFPETTT